MTARQLQWLWTVVGAALLYSALNSWIVSQGGKEIFGLKMISDKPVPAALIAIPICSVLLTITSLIGIVYARRAGAGPWTKRVPIVGLDKLKPRSLEAQLYQGTFLALFSLVPLAALAHFWNRIGGAEVVSTDKPPHHLPSMWSWSALTTLNDPARICTDFSDKPVVTCSGNVTILPGLEPAIFAVLTALAVMAAITHWRYVARP